MFKILTSIVAILMWTQAWATPTAEQPDRAVDYYNLEEGIGLKGFDPVAYFTEHGGQALQGKKSITLTYGGVTYRFSTESNRDIFSSNPSKYEPTYGGWCAWAMANEGYFDINPMLFTQHNNRMHFFIEPGAKARFDNQLLVHEKNADIFWKSESGEEPRI